MKIVCPKQSLAPEGRAGGAVGAQTASSENMIKFQHQTSSVGDF